MPASASRIDRGLLRLERTPGRPGAALVVAVAFMAIAMVRVRLGTHVTYLGKSYAMLSIDPFAPDPSNPVAYRILTPLVSYLVGLRGRSIIVTNLLIATALLAMVYLWMRAREHPPGRALLGVATIALTMTTLTTVHYGGYCDSLTYLLVFLAWRARARVGLASALFFLALLNRESAAFLAPWLWLEMASPGRGPRGGLKAGAGLAGAVAAFALVRAGLGWLNPGVEYSGSYYLTPLLHDPLHWYRDAIPHQALGLLAVFNLFWIYPALALADHLRRRAFRDAASIVLCVGCGYAQLLVAYDVSRMMTLSFMAVLLGAEHLLRTGAFRAPRWALALTVASCFVPQVNVAGGKVDPMQ